MPIRIFLLTILFPFFFINGEAQTFRDSFAHKISVEDARKLGQDAEPEKKVILNDEIPYPNPKKAGLYSAILPGAGQIYNKQYWKLGLIYGGAATAVYFIKFNTDKYQTYRKAYIASLEGRTHEFTGIYSQSALKQLQDAYKKYLDMTVLITGVGYTFQVIDAIVFAHLKNFDVSPDISMRLRAVQDPFGAGLGVVFNFK